MGENLRPLTYLHLQGESYHGNLSCKSLLLWLQQRRNISHPWMMPNNCFGWMFVSELGLNQLAYAFFSDSQSASHLSKNSMYRMKHIDVSYHWPRSTIKDQLLQLKKIHTDNVVANMLTKFATKGKLELCS